MTVQPIHLRVVNLRVEEADIRVCRPSRWGNPYRVRRTKQTGWQVWIQRSATTRLFWKSHIPMSQKEAHAFAVCQYRSWILEHPELVTALLLEINDRGTRNGSDEVTLGCWCAPMPCHAEVLAEILTERLSSPNIKRGEE